MDRVRFYFICYFESRVFATSDSIPHTPQSSRKCAVDEYQRFHLLVPILYDFRCSSPVCITRYVRSLNIALSVVGYRPLTQPWVGLWACDCRECVNSLCHHTGVTN